LNNLKTEWEEFNKEEEKILSILEYSASGKVIET